MVKQNKNQQEIIKADIQQYFDGKMVTKEENDERFIVFEMQFDRVAKQVKTAGTVSDDRQDKLEQFVRLDSQVTKEEIEKIKTVNRGFR